MSTGTVTVRPDTTILADTKVLVTRPAHQAETLVKLIETEGGKVVQFPVVEILEPRNRAALEKLVDGIDKFDLAVFVSRNAVEPTLHLVKTRGTGIPTSMAVACIGPGTACELRRHGIVTPIMPSKHFDSEGLLELPQFRNVDGKNIVIFRGEGGRELLGNTLVERGASVEYGECYRRGKPTSDITPLLREWTADAAIDVVTVTSVEGLKNLIDLVGEVGQELLRKTPVIVISARMATVSRQFGIKATIVAEAATDQAIVDAIKTWRKTQNPL